jgi:hypothetical protein
MRITFKTLNTIHNMQTPAILHEQTWVHLTALGVPSEAGTDAKDAENEANDQCSNIGATKGSLKQRK